MAMSNQRKCVIDSDHVMNGDSVITAQNGMRQNAGNINYVMEDVANKV